MNITELKSIIKSLSRSQGSYGRMYEALNNNKSWGELSRLTKKNKITTPVDLILFLEN